MKCNYKRHLCSPASKHIEQTQGAVKRLWEITSLLALHREFGFGKERIKRFVNCLNEVRAEFMARASSTDKYDRKKRELSDIDTAIIFILRELRKSGIDHREILGNDEQLVIIEEDGKVVNLDDVLDKIQV